MTSAAGTNQLVELVDSHAHLDDPKLRTDWDGVLDRARQAGVVQIVAIGTTATDSPAVVALAQDRRGLFAAVGIHPNEAAEASEDDWSIVADLARRPEVTAVGETGLDRYWDRHPLLDPAGMVRRVTWTWHTNWICR